ncbi:MAG: Asp/Glu racemase [Pseudomonadota bacterium]
MKNTTDRGSARIGVIVPVSNSNLEPDMQMMKPAGVSIHSMRAGGYDLDEIPDSEQMRQFAETSLESVLDALCAVRPDAVIYGCTSATLSFGPDYDQTFRQRMETRSGVSAITAAGALVEALRDLNIDSASFASPYTETLNREGAEFVRQSGIDVVQLQYVGEDLGNYGQGELTPSAVLQLGLQANNDRAAAVILSCTDMRAVEVVDDLETQIDKPVVTSNQALMYVACKRLGLRGNVPGRLGTLLN